MPASVCSVRYCKALEPKARRLAPSEAEQWAAVGIQWTASTISLLEGPGFLVACIAHHSAWAA